MKKFPRFAFLITLLIVYTGNSAPLLAQDLSDPGLASGARVALNTPISKTPAPDDAAVERELPDLNKDPGLYFMLAEQAETAGDIEGVVVNLKKALQLDPASSYLNAKIGAILARNRRIAEAMLLARTATMLDPQSEEAYTLLGKIYTVTGDRVRAIDSYCKALEIKPEERDLYVFIGSLQASQRMYKDAEKTFSKMIKQFPDEKEGSFYLGRVYAEDKQYDKAVEVFTGLLDKGVESASLAQVELGNVYIIQKKFPEAEKHFEEAVKLDPLNVNARLSLGQTMAGQKKFDQAYGVFEELSRLAPTNQSIQIKMALILAEQKQFDKARDILDKILQSKPNWDQVRFQLGRVLKEQGKIREAETEFVLIRKGQATFLHSRVMLALMFLKTKEFYKSLRYIDEAIESDSRDPDLFHIKGSILEELNRYSEALTMMEKALELDSTNIKIRYSFGNVLEKSGRRSKAISEMEKIIQEKPDDANALNFVGYTLAISGKDAANAEGMIKKALDLKPDDGYIMDSFGWTLFKKGRVDEGLEYLKNAYDRVKTDPIIAEHVADALAAKNEKSAAVETYRKSLQMNPDNLVVRRKLETLEAEMKKSSPEPEKQESK